MGCGCAERKTVIVNAFSALRARPAQAPKTIKRAVKTISRSAMRDLIKLARARENRSR